MKILVAGSRDWKDRKRIQRALNRYSDLDDVTLIHGGCRGADTIAGEIATDKGWTVDVYPADWKRYGNGAGPIRNAEMIAQKPDIVLLFPLPDSVGTYDTKRKAFAAGIPVKVYKPKTMF